MNEQQAINAYHKAKQSGLNMQAATYSLMKQGCDPQDAARACWLVEKGHRGPDYGLYSDGGDSIAQESAELSRSEAGLSV